MGIYTFVVVALCALLNVAILIKIRLLLKVCTHFVHKAAVPNDKVAGENPSVPQRGHLFHSAQLGPRDGRLPPLLISPFKVSLSAFPSTSWVYRAGMAYLYFVTDINCLNAPYLLIAFNPLVRRRVLKVFKVCLYSEPLLQRLFVVKTSGVRSNSVRS